MVLFALGLLAAGGALLAGGAELFAEHVVAAARRVRLTTFGLALLLAGAEPEEALVAGLSSARGHPDLAAGDALGANVVIATLTLGLVALVAPIALTAAVRRYAAVAAVAAAAATGIVATGTVPRWVGLLLVLVYLVAAVLVWRHERHPPAIGELAEADQTSGPGRPPADTPGGAEANGHAAVAQGGTGDAPPARDIALVLAGVLLMVLGGAVAVLGAERLVDATGLTDGPVGLTLLALATSAEMLALVVASRRHGVEEVAVAGALGAVAYNATVSLGVGALVAPLALVATARLVGAAALAAAVCAALAAWRGQVLGRVVGVVLVVLYVVGVALILR